MQYKQDLRSAMKANLAMGHIGVVEISVLEGDPIAELVFPDHDHTIFDNAFEMMFTLDPNLPADTYHEFYLSPGFAVDPIDLVPVTNMEPSGYILFNEKGPQARYTHNGQEYFTNGTEAYNVAAH